MSTNLMTRNTAIRHIADGMTAFGRDGEKLGTVRHYDEQNGYLDIQQGWLFHKDFYVGMSAVVGADETGVTLRLTKQDLDDDRYGAPPGIQGALLGDSFAVTEKEPVDAGH
jgi:hypothetical protein